MIKFVNLDNASHTKAEEISQKYLAENFHLSILTSQ
jgi:hypothetical protein